MGWNTRSLQLRREIIRSANRLIVLLVLAVPLFAGGQQEGSPQSAPGATSAVRRLAIEVSRGGFPLPQTDIFVVTSPHSKPKRLVEGLNPTWSPDGDKIAYCVRDGGGFGQIQLINADGSGHVQLTKLIGGACPTDWSRDGEKIAFLVYRVPDSARAPSIFVMDKNGGNVTQVTLNGWGARWSPDGKQLVFCRPPEGGGKNESIWVVNSDGTGATKVIEDNSSVLEVAWFPDGKSLIFSSEREHKHKSALFRVNLDGSSLAAIAVDKEVSLFFPVASPGGTQLVADAYATGSGEGNVVLVDLASHHMSVLAHGIHPSVLWEKQ